MISLITSCENTNAKHLDSVVHNYTPLVMHHTARVIASQLKEVNVVVHHRL